MLSPLLALALACAELTPVAPTPQPPARAVDPFLLDPLRGYPLRVDEALADRLRSAYAVLEQGGLDEARARVDALLEDDPGLHPATLLSAQLSVLADRHGEAVLQLGPVVDELPDYEAAQVLLGWAAEQDGDIPLAYDAYRQVADRQPVALRRAEALQPRAWEIQGNRLTDALDRGHLELAEEHLGVLETWDPERLETWQGRRHLARARGDTSAELAALRALADRDDPPIELLRDLATLEVEAGDLRQGLARLEALSIEYPQDGELTTALEQAKFLWRLQLLPAAVQEVARTGALTRGDFATLVYWMVPEVRYAQLTNPPIATDILDHPRRDEILRVVNFDLMTVDETRHRFRPDQDIDRLRALTALVRLLTRTGEPVACLEGTRTVKPARSVVCPVAARCGLIAEEADCLPAASVSGADALELFRRTLDHLG